MKTQHIPQSFFGNGCQWPDRICTARQYSACRALMSCDPSLLKVNAMQHSGRDQASKGRGSTAPYSLTPSLVHPLELRLVVCEALREPEPNLALCALDCIGAVDDVAAHVNAEVSADAARLCTAARHHMSAAHRLAFLGIQSSLLAHVSAAVICQRWPWMPLCAACRQLTGQLATRAVKSLRTQRHKIPPTRTHSIATLLPAH